MRAADWFTILHGTNGVIELEVTLKSAPGPQWTICLH